MVKAFSLASWNVEHLTDKDPARSQRVVDFLASTTPGGPDVFAILEVEGRDVYQHVMKKFPNHRFHQSEGRQLQEMLIGVHSRFPSFVTQRIEFQSQVDELRPGVIVTILVDSVPYTILFLHTKSGPTPYALGLRQDMMENCYGLKSALDKATAGGKSNFMFLGDLNTMGSQTFPFAPPAKKFSEQDEIDLLATVARNRKMMLLPKDAPKTFNNGNLTGDLDHVVASDHMKFKSFGNASVTVLGWPKQPPNQQQAWTSSHSDHGLLFLEVHK